MIEASSQTKWKELPPEWQAAAINAVVDAGLGKTELVVVAVIASALWERFGQGGEEVRSESDG